MSTININDMVYYNFPFFEKHNYSLKVTVVNIIPNNLWTNYLVKFNDNRIMEVAECFMSCIKKINFNNYYKQILESEIDDKCFICYSNETNLKWCKLNGCSHKYHEECICAWWEQTTIRCAYCSAVPKLTIDHLST